MFSLSILPSAEGDLESGYWFYEAQGDGLETYFLAASAVTAALSGEFGGSTPKYRCLWVRVGSTRAAIRLSAPAA